MRRDRPIAHLLLHPFGKKFHQCQTPRYPARAAIESATQLFQSIAETLLQFRQQPAFFQGRLALPPTHAAIQKQSLGLAQRPDHRLHRVPPKLGERRDALVAVDDQIMLRLLAGHHHDGRLLTAGRQRRQQPPLTFRPMHPKVLQAPLKLVQFQPHAPCSLDHSNLHQMESGIARQEGEVSLYLPWNQYHMASTGIAWSGSVVRP